MWLFEPIVEMFCLVWLADDRREARWFSIGCLVLVLIAIGLIAWYYSM